MTDNIGSSENRAVFITGAAKSTGYGIAEVFAAHGWHVCLTSRRAASAEEAAERLSRDSGVTAYGFGLEVGPEDAVKDVFSRIDGLGLRVEAVVLCAANMGFGTDPAVGMDFFSVPVDEVRGVFETNLVWNFTVVRQAALRMREQGGGSVVFIGSNTSYRAIPGRFAYGASKGGINAMSKALAVDLGRYGIRCNTVLPGTIKTERWVSMGDRRIVTGEFTPIGDISDYSDIANAAYFLGSDLSKNITGAELTVDGGMSCQLYPQVLADLKREKQARNEKSPG